VQAIGDAGYNTDVVKIAIDAASTEFFADGKYSIDGKKLSAEEMIAFYQQMLAKYPIISIEDGLSEDDFDGWALLEKKLGDTIMTV